MIYQQDFENTPPLQKLEKYLKRQVPHYWKEKSKLVGYQDSHMALRQEEASPSKNDKTFQSSIDDDNGDMAIVGSVDAYPSSNNNLGTVTTTTIATYRVPEGVLSDEAKARARLKTPSKCLQQMQPHVSYFLYSVLRLIWPRSDHTASIFRSRIL